MSINVDEVVGKMATVGAQAFGASWGEVERFAQLEFKTLAHRIQDIGEGMARGDFDLPTAKLLTAMQVNNATAAIAGATTLVTLAVEAAINAVLAAVKDAINTGLGVALL
jgi:hypothetical protein